VQYFTTYIKKFVYDQYSNELLRQYDVWNCVTEWKLFIRRKKINRLNQTLLYTKILKNHYFRRLLYYCDSYITLNGSQNKKFHV